MVSKSFQNFDAAGTTAFVEGPSGPPDATLPLVVLLHGLGGNSLDMTNPSVARAGTAFVRTTTYPVYTDRGFQFVAPPPIPVAGFYLDPPDTNLTSWQRALIDAGFTTVVYNQSGPLIANDAAQLTSLASGPLSTDPDLAGLRIAFVAHSRGGLVARAFLVTAAASPALTGFLGRLTSVVTLHSPHLGSGVASLGASIATLLARIGALLTSLGVTPPAFLATLAGAVLSPAIAELVVGTPTAAVAPGEPVPGVTYHTFGGASTAFSRLWADMYTPDSYAPIPLPFVPFPAFHLGTTPVPVGTPLDAASFSPATVALSSVPPVLALATAVVALVGSTPEFAHGIGDTLVTDARSRLPFAASHTTNPLNHAEALWDRTLQAQVVAILSRLRTSVSPPAQSTIVPDVREMSRSGATTELRGADLVPSFTGPSGSGSWVSSQSPPAGRVVSRGTTVTCRLSRGPIP